MNPFNLDWGSIFVPDTPLFEIFIRGTITYLGIFALLRFVLKRQSGGVAITDVLVIVLIADAAQNAMAADYHSVPDGLFLVSTIVFWSFALDWLAYRIPFVARLVDAPPVALIRLGKPLIHNLRAEQITLDDLQAMLRQQGIERIDQVKRGMLESDGKLSAILFEPPGKPLRRTEPPLG